MWGLGRDESWRREEGRTARFGLGRVGDEAFTAPGIRQFDPTSTFYEFK